MPTYSYSCTSCEHEHSEVRSYDDRLKKTKCDKCGSVSKYIISAPQVWDDADTRWIRQHECEGNGVRSHG